MVSMRAAGSIELVGKALLQVSVPLIAIEKSFSKIAGFTPGFLVGEFLAMSRFLFPVTRVNNFVMFCVCDSYNPPFSISVMLAAMNLAGGRCSA